MKLPKKIAHRGASGFAPENTLAAMQKAKELGATWVEFDVQLTADNELVIFHDEMLNRTTNGDGPLWEASLSDLEHLDAGAWFSPDFQGEVIPTLDVLLAALAELELLFNLEIKVTHGRDEILVEKVLASLQYHWPCSLPKPLLSSFSQQSTELLCQLAADYPRAYLMRQWRDDCLQEAKRLNSATVHIDERELTPDRVAQICDAGYPLLVYTVDDEARAEELFSWGVTSIFTNRLL